MGRRVLKGDDHTFHSCILDYEALVFAVYIHTALGVPSSMSVHLKNHLMTTEQAQFQTGYFSRETACQQ